MLHYILASLIETAKLTVVLTLVLSIPMCYPRSRHVIVATVKFVVRKSPWWAVPIMWICGLIPGQADEIVVAAILLIPILRVAHNRRTLARTVRYAWNV